MIETKCKTCLGCENYVRAVEYGRRSTNDNAN